jgi:hemerythrin-like domain-containing protein
MKVIDKFMQEHRVIERVLFALERAATRLSRGEDVYLRFFIGTSVLINGFANSYHDKKEEAILLPVMIELGLPRDSGMVAVILAEHEEGHRLSQRLRQATERLQSGDIRARDQVVLSALGYVSLIRRHIKKEDEVLFPMIEKMILPIQQEQMLAALDLFEREENGAEVEEKYYGLADRLVMECVR